MFQKKFIKQSKQYNMKFIKYQIMRSCGLHLEYIYNLVLIYVISTIDNRLSILLLLALFLEIIAFELFSYRKFMNDKQKTSSELIEDLDNLVNKIQHLENGQETIKEDLNTLKKVLEKGQEETIRLLKNLNENK